MFCLNRTFYGIETQLPCRTSQIVQSLNRTFYGIETRNAFAFVGEANVLIVPFMELKQ